jgi:hypothetical protein
MQQTAFVPQGAHTAAWAEGMAMRQFSRGYHAEDGLA